MSGSLSWVLIAEQSLNGLQFGLMLFLLAAGLTLVFGIMDMINLAHGSLYMLGAFVASSLVQATGSFWLGASASLRPYVLTLSFVIVVLKTRREPKNMLACFSPARSAFPGPTSGSTTRLPRCFSCFSFHFSFFLRQTPFALPG